MWDHSDKECIPFQFGCLRRETWPVYNMEFWERLFEDDQNGRFEYRRTVSIGEEIVEYVHTVNHRKSKSIVYPIALFGHYLWAANIPWENSLFYKDLVENVGTEKWDPPEGFFMFSFRKGSWYGSVYSADTTKFDAFSIAKRFGGGGHAGAAGFHCEELPREVFVPVDGRVRIYEEDDYGEF